MKYFLDAEFHEDGKTIELISIAIVCEDGRELYMENTDYDWSKSTEWLLENVKPNLWGKRGYDSEITRTANQFNRDGGIGGIATLMEIARTIARFVDPETYGKPEFWGYYAAYDWVLLCQLFGKMIDLPKGWPMYINDIKSFQEVLKPELTFVKPHEDNHHALNDARNIASFHVQVFDI